MIAIHFCFKRDGGTQNPIHRRFDQQKMREDGPEYNPKLWLARAFGVDVADLPRTQPYK
jgi:hypothetical protein